MIDPINVGMDDEAIARSLQELEERDYEERIRATASPKPRSSNISTIDEDYELAKALQDEESSRGRTVRMGVGYGPVAQYGALAEFYNKSNPKSIASNEVDDFQLAKALQEAEELRIRTSRSIPAGNNNQNGNELVDRPLHEIGHVPLPGGGSGGGGQQQMSDAEYARNLQLQEYQMLDYFVNNFEIPDDFDEEENTGDFNDKEVRASKCSRQLMTISTMICLSQIALLIACIQTGGGLVPYSENTMFGPSAYTLMKYGAKETWLITVKGQWWRLITPIFLHAGIIHIASNVLIQLRLGGYLNLAYGNLKWLSIYFLSGIYGNMFSCIFLTDSVGVGSSGALLGILSSWMVWIVFRWWKIPPRYHFQRNMQLVLLVVSIGLTLGLSFEPLIDWAAHMGGFVIGVLLGCLLFAHELGTTTNPNRSMILIIRISSVLLTISAFIWAIYTMVTSLHPHDLFAGYTGH